MPQTSLRRALSAGALYFAVVFAAGFALGAIRGLVIAPAIGETAAVAIELPIILAISWMACHWIVARTAIAPTISARAIMGASAFTLLIAAEALLALGLGRSLTEHLATYRDAASLLGLTGQLAFAAFPLLQRLLRS